MIIEINAAEALGEMGEAAHEAVPVLINRIHESHARMVWVVHWRLRLSALVSHQFQS